MSSDERRVHLVHLLRDETPPGKPFRVGVTEALVAGKNEAPLRLRSVPDGCLVVRGEEIHALGFARLRGHLPWDPARERVLGVGSVGRWGALAIATEVGLVSTTGGLLRYRIFRGGREPVVKDLRLRPVSRAAAIEWWWRDPHLADGEHTGWLLASALLGLLCSAAAWRRGRIRCANRVAAATWMTIAFLLGPLGLLTFRIAVPDVVVREVGGARRAVDLERCPATDAPWPEPGRDGTEVLV